MPHLSVNQQTTNVKKDCPLPIADTYANAILRTLSSLKPPSPTISKYRRSHVVNEVSGLKTCIHQYTLHFLTLIFKWKLMGEVPPRSFFLFYLLVMSYIQDVMIVRLSLKSNISVCGDDKLILYKIQRLSLSRNSDQLYIHIRVCIWHKLSNEELQN